MKKTASFLGSLVNPLIEDKVHLAPIVNLLRRARHRQSVHGLAATISGSQPLTFLDLNRVRPTTAINYNDRGEAFRRWVEAAQIPILTANQLDSAL